MGKFAQRRSDNKGHAPVNNKALATTSVFAQRRAKVQVAQVPSNADEVPQMPESFTSLAQCQAALQVHRARLKTLTTLEDKANYKRTALQDLEPFVQEYLLQGHNYPNDVAVWLAIWYIDCGMIEPWLRLALHLQAQGQKMPPMFSSSMEVWICDQIYDYAADKYKNQQSADPYFWAVLAVLDEHKWDLYEPVGSKMWAMAAKLASLKDDHAMVVTFGEKALAMNDRAGVKKLVNAAKAALEKEAKAKAEAEAAEQGLESEPKPEPDTDKNANEKETEQASTTP